MDAGLKLYLPNGGSYNVRGTKDGAVRMYKHIPDFATLAAKGQLWAAHDTTTNVALVARPTTLASLTAQNPAGSATYKVVFAVTAYTDVVGAGLATVSFWHCVHKLPVAALTRDLVLQGSGAGTAMSFRGGKSYDGDFIFDRGATVVDDGWIPVGTPIDSTIATTNFVTREFPLIVPVVLPPGQHYSLQSVATVVTYETSFGLVWGEVTLDELMD